MKPLNVAMACGGWGHYGGLPSWIWNFTRGLESSDVEYRIILAGTACEHWHNRLPFSGPDYLQDCDVVFIVHLYPIFSILEQQKTLFDQVRRSGKPAYVLFLDARDWRWDGFTDVAKWLNPAGFVFNSVANRDWFYLNHKDWVSRARLKVYPQPYQRIAEGNEFTKNGRAVCTARIAPEKRTHTIAQAGGVEFWTTDPGNQSYYNVERFGGKASNIPGYRGPIGDDDGALERVYGTASCLVDLSHLEGDGGRTQYTFLEAMDFGLSIVAATDWARDKATDEFRPHEHYYPALTVEEIQAGIKQAQEKGNIYADAHKKLLAVHDSRRVVEQMIADWQ